MMDEKEVKAISDDNLGDVNGGVVMDRTETANGSPRGMFTEEQLKKLAEETKKLFDQ